MKRKLIGLVFALIFVLAKGQEISCDILVAGGSAASVAAAWTAAEVLTSGTVCLTDPTDWIGGQLTASAVSAIDFGSANSPNEKHDDNLPLSFRALIDTFQGNPGGCWVSAKCFQPQILLQKFLWPHTFGHKNLKVYLNTVVTKTIKDSNGKIVEVQAVQRTPTPGTTGWESLLSETLEDWYSPVNSTKFSKQTLRFTNFKVIIEATEFGDVLMTGEIPTAQGIETPYENSTTFLDTCGQANTIDFYMEYLTEKPNNPWTPPRGCEACNSTEQYPSCCSYYVAGGNAKDWDRVWTYRRVLDNGSQQANPGDISLQNYGSQDAEFYLFLSLADSQKQVQEGRWAGGVNISALSYSEQRSYGWYWYFYENATETVRPYLVMTREQTGTPTGLAKMPYLRDTRRALHGILDFRLLQPQLAGLPPYHGAPGRGFKFADTIGIGEYNVDIHTGACTEKLPDYLKNRQIQPYYIPFRSLTVKESPNLLLAGKTMAQTFHANAATRLHPEEWVTGNAAGASAALMVLNGWDTTTEVYNNVEKLQSLLLTLGQPLEWKL